MHSAAAVEVLFEPEGVDDHAGVARAGRAAQHATTSRVVDILLLAVGTGIVHGQVVEAIIGKGGCRAIDIAAGDVAPGVITARVGLSGFIAAGRAQAVEPGQLVRVAAVAVEIL